MTIDKIIDRNLTNCANCAEMKVIKGTKTKGRCKKALIKDRIIQYDYNDAPKIWISAVRCDYFDHMGDKNERI